MSADKVWLDACLEQCLQHADLDRAQAAAAGKDEGGPPGPRINLVAVPSCVYAARAAVASASGGIFRR